MKRLLCVVALAMPGLSMASVGSAQAAGPQAVAAQKAADPARHHPLIEVKFVLVRAPQESGDLPQVDLGNQRSTIVPLWLTGRHAGSLRGNYVNPNMYWCSSWGCMDGSR